MNLRLKLGYALIRLGRLLPYLAVGLMRPKDLMELNRQRYCRPGALEDWGKEELAGDGLYPGEQEMLESIPLKSGRVLILGVGSGREAIALGRQGFEVVGLDFSPGMVAQAQKNAARQGMNLEGIVQNFSSLEVPADSFDLMVLSAAMYSSIPTCQKRIQMLRRINRGLKPGGYFFCEFQLDPQFTCNSRTIRAMHLFALLTGGNRDFEVGDIIWGSEFSHVFQTADELRSEFIQGGFEALSLHSPRGGWSRAILRKPEERPTR
jgi:ubiquinone/menaquinone biosynthesis C-methylase UbiE